MMSGTNEYYIDLDKQYYLPVFNRLPLAIDRAQGTTVYDVEGNEYLDLLAGIAVNNTGHCHPHVVQAVQAQAAQLMHISNFYVSKPQVLLSQKLVKTSGLDRAFFTNSGAESVEGAVKIARKYARSIGRGSKVLSIQECFHGRTLGAIATGDRAKQEPFGPLPEAFVQIPRNDIAAFREHLDTDLAAILVEPVQGEGGVHVADLDYLIELRKLCTEHGVVLIFDEIQAGMGRIGTLFAWQHFNVKPDIITLAKGLGSGFPVGAVLCSHKVSGAMSFGDHGTTFGGNPLACAAALASIEVLEREKLPERAKETGQWLRQQLEDMMKTHNTIQQVRGCGLMIGVQLSVEARPLVLNLLRRGILANATATNVLRLVPPLTISRDELRHFLTVFTDELLQLPKHHEA